MPEINEILTAAVHLHREGRLQEAWQAYQQVLVAQPRHPAALNAAGLLLRQSGRFDQAAQYCRMAVAADPSEAAYHANLAEALRGLGQLSEGIECYREAARLAPAEFVVHYQLASLYAQAGMHDEAIAEYECALELRAEAEAYHALGSLYQQQGRLSEAADCYRQALALQPDRAQTLIEVATLLQSLGQEEEALAYLQAAVDRQPDNADAQCRLGSALFDMARLAEARGHFERAVALDPSSAGLHYNLGSLLLAQCELDAAIAAFDRAIELKPDYHEARCARGTARLAKGDFAAGWSDYESRLQCTTGDVPRVARPRWDGSPFEGRTLLVYGEQGFGDTLQFVRYARLARQRGGRVIVAVRPPLLRLLAESDVAEVVSSEAPLPDFDLFAPLLSLPAILGTEVGEVPYLRAEPARVEAWRERLPEQAGLRVGIAWQGARTFRNDHLRSIPLASFAPLAAVPGTRLFSLQKDLGREQIAALTSHGTGAFSVVDLADALGDFADTAAAMQNLDLVISSDSAVAHLAGALGRPVWVAVSAAPDWRWMLERDDCLWYPTMRLFRQRALGQWSSVFEHMADELSRLASSGR